MPKTPRRRGAPEDDDAQPPAAKRAAPDAVWATELPTDLWKRCLDFAYGPATLCVDPLAPLKAAATLAMVSRGTQRAMADPGLWKDLARGSERCGCDKIVLAADVGGFGAQNGRPWRVLGRALRDFLKKCTHCRAVEAPIRVPFGVRLCNACATIRPGGALIREGRARDDYHLAAADLRELPFLDTPRRSAPPPVPDFTEAPPVTQSPALVFSPRSGEVALDVAPPVEERVFGGAPFLSPPPHTRAPPAERVFARRHLVFAQQRRFGTAAAVDVLDRDADAARTAVDAARRAAATEELLQAYSL